MAGQSKKTMCDLNLSQETSMKSVSLAAASLLVLFSLSAQAADPVPLKTSDGVLVDAKGMTVYTFDKDAANSGTSACTGKCAANWPAVPAGDAQPPAPYSTITREDGSKQLAYKGKPLYTFMKDKKPGDKSGDKLMNNNWHAVTE
jgi:predicted lipoprotein with Yx(FWY)xxD motif